MPNMFIVEAETNGAGSGSLPAVGSLSPPSPPTLAYFRGQNAQFTNVQVLPINVGDHGLLTRALTDVVLLYSEAPASVRTGHVPGSHVNLAAGVSNGQYLNRSAFKAA
jgi:hypothetical protein